MTKKPIKVTLGGDRIGSGNKMVQRMRNFDRSSFDISTIWASSMAPGVITPCFCDLATIGTTYEMEINELVRTIPTNGPLFGSFELRVEVFFYPLRLTQGILHNNPIALGLNANQVILPTAAVELTTLEAYNEYLSDGGNMPLEHASAGVSSLINYCGAQALPLSYTADDQVMEIAAGPMFAYYDYVKNYHINKQEDNAYVITNEHQKYSAISAVLSSYAYASGGNIPIKSTTKMELNPLQQDQPFNQPESPRVAILPNGQNTLTIRSYIKDYSKIAVTLRTNTSGGTQPTPWLWLNQYPNILQVVGHKRVLTDSIGDVYETSVVFQTINGQWPTEWGNQWVPDGAGNAPSAVLSWIGFITSGLLDKYGLQLTPFPIKNFDRARYTILDNNALGSKVVIKPRTATNASNVINYLPYCVNVETNETTKLSRNADSMNGLCVKCYKSDLFNNWLNTEWIDGPNGINELSAIPVKDGVVMVEDLIVHKKVYQMLNRVAINDGTYHGYQEALWGESSWKNVESAIYCGGMSTEIVFDEVINSSASEVGGEEQPLGTLGGRGRAMNKKGGQIKVRVDEAGYVMAVVSITPRIKYGSACKYYMTDVKTFADLHNPNMDNIGFQNLPVRQMAGWSGSQDSSMSAGKQPSWIQYQTNYDTVHGDFAVPSKAGWMVLERKYSPVQNSNAEYVVGDLTTYIDPTLYNEAFADKALEAQNFWVQLGFNIIARRKMSANQIPNL